MLKGRVEVKGRKVLNLGQRSIARRRDPSWFNERLKVILGQVLCRDYMLNTLPREKRDNTGSDKINNTALIRTNTHAREQL